MNVHLTANHPDISPVHAWLEGLHRVQVDVAVVPAHGEHPAHHGGHAHPPTRRGQLRHVLPVVGARVEALHRAQGGVVIEAACPEEIQEKKRVQCFD